MTTRAQLKVVFFFYHGVNKVAKSPDIAKMAKNRINCISCRATPLRTNPTESEPGNTFLAHNRKKQK